MLMICCGHMQASTLRPCRHRAYTLLTMYLLKEHCKSSSGLQGISIFWSVHFTIWSKLKFILVYCYFANFVNVYFSCSLHPPSSRLRSDVCCFYFVRIFSQYCTTRTRRVSGQDCSVPFRIGCISCSFVIQLRFAESTSSSKNDPGMNQKPLSFHSSILHQFPLTPVACLIVSRFFFSVRRSPDRVWNS